MRPVACGMDILQGEKATRIFRTRCSNGAWCLKRKCTLAVIANLPDALLEDPTNPLTLVISFINGLKAGLSRRFEEMNIYIDMQLAAVVQTHFKLYWLNDQS